MFPKIVRNKSVITKFVFAVSFGGMAGLYLANRNSRLQNEEILKNQ